MKFPRRSGVLLHPSALQTAFGIGDFGPSAYDFIDKLHEAKQSYWQILPITQANLEGCPYSSFGAFGGYDLLISPEALVDYGLIENHELKKYHVASTKVDFDKVALVKNELLLTAYNRFINTDRHNLEFEIFKQKQEFWLDDYATFIAITHKHSIPWTNWPINLKDRNFKELPADINAIKDIEIFKQFIFHKQWLELKNYANNKNIKIVGDIPIFVAHHSVDVWKNRSLFKLAQSGELDTEAGAPPDAFNDLGQKWNNPNYNWQKMKENGFDWWNKRIGYMLELFDIIRIDHFIGFYNVWEIPHIDPDARNGRWVKSNGDELLSSLEKNFPEIPFMAEDLGDVSKEVIELRDKFNLPGMKIIQFAFDGNENNLHLPKFITEHSVTYTGTHDNNTINGNLDDILERNNSSEIECIKEALGGKIPSSIHKEFMNIAFETKSNTVITPLQDILGLRSDGRFNVPGTVKNNWNWMISNEHNLEEGFCYLKDLTLKTKRMQG